MYVGSTNVGTGSAYLRLNNTTDILISSVFSCGSTFVTYTATPNQEVSAGDYYQFKVITPGFSNPNPTTCRMTAQVTIRIS